MGRGSMARRIEALAIELAAANQAKRDAVSALGKYKEAMEEAYEALAGIAADDHTWQGQEAKAALDLIAHILGGK